MMKKIRAITVLFLALLPLLTSAQPEPEDIGKATDEFQDAFYDALREKGIENYDRAITALEKCAALQPDNAAVQNEFGKNYLALKQYDKAYAAFEKASKLDPKNRWYVAGMYDVLYATKEYEKAIPVVRQLITFKPEYKEDLVSLYMNTQQFDKALALIDELNASVGKSEKRELYRAQILRDAKFQAPERDNLEQAIRQNPKEESNYLQLIDLYNESGQSDKARAVEEQLRQNMPDSDWAQVTSFKTDLDKQDGNAAMAALSRVLPNPRIDNKIKHRMLNEMLIFAQGKPQLDDPLQQAVASFTSDKDIAVAREVGKFYHSKKDWPHAAAYYQMQLARDGEDVETAILLLQVYDNEQAHDKMIALAEAMLDKFPLQPQFYLYAGAGYAGKGDAKKAKDLLESGVDYIVENPEMEADFQSRLASVYTQLHDTGKADAAKKRAQLLLQRQK
jgi:tetratricopeptide (TPR) repeat protein